MSVDLEDHFCDLPFSTWKNYETRVGKTIHKILGLFEKHNVLATFFTVGFVAEQNPELIELICSKGHEISSHSYSHTHLKKLRKEEFESDLLKSLNVLSKLAGEKILGFRAPWFSVNKENLWVFQILKKYLKYDSSVYPAMFHYGVPDAPTHIYKISNKNPLVEDENNSFTEVPLATLPIPLIGNFPIAGGIYLRFLPTQFFSAGIKKLNKNGFSATCYIHLQDLDQNRPHLKGTPWHNYIGLKNSSKKFEKLLDSFKFSTVRDVLNL